ncbi:hypothetical protein ACJX0J_042292, partial [Zea mays]
MENMTQDEGRFRWYPDIDTVFCRGCVDLLDSCIIKQRQSTLDDTALEYLSEKLYKVTTITISNKTLINRWNRMKQLYDDHVLHRIHSSNMGETKSRKMHIKKQG